MTKEILTTNNNQLMSHIKKQTLRANKQSQQIENTSGFS